MFERYTEKSRRVIFFARYEASQLGSSHIETEHLLLGLLREDHALREQFLGSRSAVDQIRTQIEKHSTIGEKVSTSVDMPLSRQSKHVLAFAAEEAERSGQKCIGPTHLLAGMLREEKCYGAEILGERGVQLSMVRQQFGREPSEPPARVTYRGGRVPPMDSAGLKETYLALRRRIVTEGFPCLNGVELEEEIARRKGLRRDA